MVGALAGAMPEPDGTEAAAGRSLWDAFERPDTQPGTLGTAPTGHVWRLRGPYGTTEIPLASVTDGWYVTPPGQTAYAVADLDAPAGSVRGVAAWPAGARGSAVLLTSTYADLFSRFTHLNVTNDRWWFHVIEGSAWPMLASGTHRLTPDQPYGFGMQFIPGGVVLSPPAGAPVTVMDARIGAAHGRYTVWELWTAPGVLPPRFTAVEALART